MRLSALLLAIFAFTCVTAHAQPATSGVIRPVPVTPASATSSTSARRRTGPSLGEHQQQGLPLPRRPLLRDDQAGQLHDRGCGEGIWRSS